MSQPEAVHNGPESQPGSSETKKTNKGPMLGRPILFLDLETTGLNPGQHEITEVGALLVSQPDFQVLGSYNTKVMPVHLQTATPVALEIGHFNLETWQREAKPLAAVMAELAAFGKDAILSGFNLTFDWAFLQAAFNEVGLEDPFYYHRFDVMSAAFAILLGHPELNKFSLSELCRFFKITNKAAHTAYADAEATFEVFKGLITYKRAKETPAAETEAVLQTE